MNTTAKKTTVTLTSDEARILVEAIHLLAITSPTSPALANLMADAVIAHHAANGKSNPWPAYRRLVCQLPKLSIEEAAGIYYTGRDPEGPTLSKRTKALFPFTRPFRISRHSSLPFNKPLASA